jgi:hypothetical protein
MLVTSVPPLVHITTSSVSGSLRLSKNQKKECLASTSTYPVNTLGASG